MDHKLPEAAPSTTLDARMVRTRAALHAALLGLLEQKPFGDITIRDIAARSGTGYATFFRHYETKEALLNDMVADEIAAVIRLSMPGLRETDSRAAARALCLHVDARHRLWTALLTGGAAGTVREEFIRQARQIPPIPADPESWLPADLRVVYGVGSTVEILAWWLPRRDGFSIEQVAEILDRLVITPATAPD